MSHSRREFVKLGLTLSGGLLFRFEVARARVASATAPYAPNIYVRIDPDNTVTLGLLKQEMGQGVETGLPMILADELGADWGALQVEVVPFDASLPGFRERFGLMETGGSTSTMSAWSVLRRAAASVRETFILAAARGWDVEPHECRAAGSKVHHDASGRSAAFGSLIEAAAKIEPPSEPRLKDADERTLIGRPLHTRKSSLVVQGLERYGIDVRVPNMVYAAIARSPVVGGRIAKLDDGGARKVAGVIAVVNVPAHQGGTPHWRIEEGVAVVANSTWAAFKGRDALHIVWEEGHNKNASVEQGSAQFAGKVADDAPTGWHVGNVETAFAAAQRSLEAEYEVPYFAHQLMEPLNAVADVRGDSCEVWAGCQSPQYTSHYLAELLGIPIEKIRFHPQASGGGFGRRFFADYVAEAALVSKQIGRPVMSVWSREDEVRHGRYHPMRHDRYRAAIDETGALAAIDYFGVTSFFRPASLSMIYPVPHMRERQAQLEPIVNVGAWRSVDAHPAVFGRESLIDEIAALASTDPFDYRLQLLNRTIAWNRDSAASAAIAERLERLRPRLLRVLTRLRAHSRWDESRKSGRHCGVALSDFHDSSICGQVAEIVKTPGGLRVSKVTCVLECGTIINPQLVRAQIEGSILWALTAVLYGGVTVREGRVVESNFHDMPIVRMDEVPQVDIELLESDAPPQKVGEAAVPTLAPAVANAVFAATGKRVRTFPFPDFATQLNKKAS